MLSSDALTRVEQAFETYREEERHADSIGQADGRAGRVRLGARHDDGDHRLPRREAAVQLVAVPLRRDLLSVLRGCPVSDLLARDVPSDGLPPPGRRAGARGRRPMAGPAAGGAPGRLRGRAAADQGARLSGRDVAAPPNVPRAAGPVDLVPALVLLSSRLTRKPNLRMPA